MCRGAGLLARRYAPFGFGLRRAGASATRRLVAGLRLSVLLAAWALVACTVPRQVHEPPPPPQTRIASQHLELVVPNELYDPPAGSGELGLPRSFGADVASRLATLVTGQGPALSVVITSASALARELVDSRGEMTRVLVRLELEIRILGGPLLRRGQAESRADLPRNEASYEEIQFLLRSTAANALDRYFALERTPRALNADIAAYRRQHPEALAPAR